MSGIKKIKRKFIIVLILFIAIIWGILLYQRFNQPKISHFEDTNGENKELAKILDENIEKIDYDYLIDGYNFSGKGDVSGVDEYYTKYDYSEINLEFEKFSGIFISNAYLGKGEKINFKIKSEILEGNLKIVITDQTKKILYVVPIDQETTVSFIAEKDKTYFVKIVGESAKINLEITRSEN